MVKSAGIGLSQRDTTKKKRKGRHKKKPNKRDDRSRYRGQGR